MDKNTTNNAQPKQETLGSQPGVEAVADTAIAGFNKKIIIWSLVAIVVVAVVALVMYFTHSSGTAKANEAIGAADIEMNDSLQFQMYKKIADDGNYDANERAKIMVAARYYQDGKYQEALGYLDKASLNSEIVEPGIQSLKGDCYANLGKLDDALKCYNKGLSAADNNPAIVPFLKVKIANIYREQKNYGKEYEVYSEIQTQYPQYLPDVDKYIERARVAAGK